MLSGWLCNAGRDMPSFFMAEVCCGTDQRVVTANHKPSKAVRPLYPAMPLTRFLLDSRVGNERCSGCSVFVFGVRMI